MAPVLKYHWLILSILLLSRLLFSKEVGQYPVQIDTVIIVGNEHTKAHVILREIPYHFPDTLSEKALLKIKNRIQNLFLFNRVELEIHQVEQKQILLILLTESWYVFPVPLLFINEHDWKKLSYGVQLTHYNFRGRNEKLRIGGWWGYNPAFYASHFNPWIGQNTRLILGLGISRRKIENKIFPIKEDRLIMDITLGRKFSLNFETQFNFAFQKIKLPSAYQSYTVSQKGEDLVPVLSWQLKWDKRDLYEYPKNGFLIAHNFRKFGFSPHQPDFWRFEFDNRLYLPIYRGLSLGGRELLIINEGEMPVYQRVFLGFEERIRGYFYEVFPDPALYQRYTSTSLSLSSLELRFPIVPIRYFSFADGPVMPSLYRDLKFGISAGIFMDSGIVWQNQNEFTLKNFYTGYGIGLHFHLPYIYLLRIELAINDQQQAQMIIDAATSF